MHLSRQKEGTDITDFEKAVKIKLIEQEKTQRWLLGEVNKKNNTHSDDAYLNSVIRGKRKSAPVTRAIQEILGLGS